MRSVVESWLALRPCPACRTRAATRDGVCRRCSNRWLGAAVAVEDRARPASAELIALGAYRGELGRLVRAAKYRPDRRLLALIGEALGRRVRATLADPGAAWLVVPVPGDRSRLRRRGLDHALLVATATASALGPRAALRPGLRRVRRTRPQAGLSDGERRANLDGAIAWCSSSGDLGGASVLLVDDVLTTGATARACRAALAAAGAGRVVVAVAARAR